MKKAKNAPEADTSAPSRESKTAKEDGAAKPPVSRLLERMKRVDPTIAERYHQKGGE